MTSTTLLVGYVVLIAAIAFLISWLVNRIRGFYLVIALSVLGTIFYQSAVYFQLGHKDKFLVIAVTVQLLISLVAAAIGVAIANILKKKNNRQSEP